MVLRRYADAPGLKLLYRMIASPVTELQLERAAAECAAENLIAEADSHDRLPAGEPPDRVHDIAVLGRVARSRGEHDPIRIVPQQLFRGRGTGVDGGIASEIRQAADDIVFDPAIEQRD